MRKRKGALQATLVTAIVVAMCIPMKTMAYVYYNYEYNNYRNVTIIEDKSNDGTVTYTNRANGKTYTVYADGTTTGDSDYLIKSGEAFSKYMVQVGSNATITIPMPYNQTLGTLKIAKGKKNLAAGISFKNLVTNYKENLKKDSSTGKYFYRDYVTGERVYVEDKNADIRVNKAVYHLRLYGKKTGKAKIVFPVLDINGTEIGKKVINIDITDNDQAIKNVTFEGKSLEVDIQNMRNYIGSGDSQNKIPYVTQKKGRFKVKANKYWQIKAIYMKKAVGYEHKDFTNPNGEHGSYMDKAKKGIDLNGDGDYNDVIYGIEEKAESEWTYEKIRNGQVVKLSNVPDSLTKTVSYYDRKGNGPNYEYNENTKSNIATTYFIIVYRDKRNGDYRTAEYSLGRRISKK